MATIGDEIARDPPCLDVAHESADGRSRFNAQRLRVAPGQRKGRLWPVAHDLIGRLPIALQALPRQACRRTSVALPVAKIGRAAVIAIRRSRSALESFRIAATSPPVPVMVSAARRRIGSGAMRNVCSSP